VLLLVSSNLEQVYKHLYTLIDIAVEKEAKFSMSKQKIFYNPLAFEDQKLNSVMGSLQDHQSIKDLIGVDFGGSPGTYPQ